MPFPLHQNVYTLNHMPLFSQPGQGQKMEPVRRGLSLMISGHKP